MTRRHLSVSSRRWCHSTRRSAGHRTAGIAFAVMLLAQLGGAGAAQTGGFDPDDWLQGADGLFSALAQVDRGARPLVVYFNADWCGYCRQFEKVLLGSDTVKGYLNTGFAVLIKPERSQREQEIARYYGVIGFPAFYVYGHSSKRLIEVQRLRVVDDKPQMLTPEEFVAAIKEASKS